MSIFSLIEGFIIGFSIAAPIGPVGILCIKRSIEKGALVGFVSGFGAATVDVFYGIVAGFGITVISNFLISNQSIIRIIGAILLIAIAVKIYFEKPQQETRHKVHHETLFFDYISTLGVNLTNPYTIVAYSAVFAGLGLSIGENSIADAVSFVLGIFLGSMLWWTILSVGVSALKLHMNHALYVWIHRLAAITITIFSFLIISKVFQ